MLIFCSRPSWSLFCVSVVLNLSVAVCRSGSDGVEGLCSSGSRVSAQLHLQQQHSGLSSERSDWNTGQPPRGHRGDVRPLYFVLERCWSSAGVSWMMFNVPGDVFTFRSSIICNNHERIMWQIVFFCFFWFIEKKTLIRGKCVSKDVILVWWRRHLELFVRLEMEIATVKNIYMQGCD